MVTTTAITKKWWQPQL